MTEPLQNRVVVFNTAKAPTDELQNRRIMIHAVDKAAIIQKELSCLDEPVDSLFSKKAPYCHVDLTPVWAYDFEKATLLNCAHEDGEATTDANDGDLPTSAVAAIAICGVASVTFAAIIVYMRSKEIAGQPLFTPLMQNEPKPELKL